MALVNHTRRRKGQHEDRDGDHDDGKDEPPPTQVHHAPILSCWLEAALHPIRPVRQRAAIRRRFAAWRRPGPRTSASLATTCVVPALVWRVHVDRFGVTQPVPHQSGRIDFHQS